MIILLLGEVNVFWDEKPARCGTGEVVMRSGGFYYSMPHIIIYCNN